AAQCVAWAAPVITYTARTGSGIGELWGEVLAHKEKLNASGELTARRREQQVKWMWTMLEERLNARLRSDASVRTKLRQAEAQVAAGRLAPTLPDEATWRRPCTFESPALPVTTCCT